MYHALIVDDERAEREGLDALIRKLGYPLETTLQGNGVEALAAMQKKRFDMLISDIVMPQMDGLALCTQARAKCPGLVTIISSAYDDFKYTQSAIRIGVDDYILKPIVVESFKSTIDHALNLIRARLNGQVEFPLRAADENGNHLIQDIKSLIQNHYNEDIGLEWVAQRMYLSPGYLSSLFKEKTNRTVMQYITLCRMRRACYLLTRTNIKVLSIGREVGYPNPSYFGFLFKKTFNVTPNQLREGVSADVMAQIQATLE